jgi:hypothetical protein
VRRLPVLILAFGLSACGGAAPSSDPSPTDAHTGHGDPDPGSPHPSVPEDADGIIELELDFAVGGDGVTVAEALRVASSHPVLITGVLVRGADGRVWICDTMAESDPPSCASPRAVVTNWPTTAPVFEPENATSTGARTEGGVTWIPDQQVFGVAHPG